MRLWERIRAMFAKPKVDRRKAEVEALEARVLGKQIEESISRQRFRSVLEKHSRKYHPSAIARSLEWKKDDS